MLTPWSTRWPPKWRQQRWARDTVMSRKRESRELCRDFLQPNIVFKNRLDLRFVLFSPENPSILFHAHENPAGSLGNVHPDLWMMTLAA